MFDYLPMSEDEYNELRDERFYTPDPYDAFGGWCYCDHCNTRYPAIGDCNCADNYPVMYFTVCDEKIRAEYVTEYRKVRESYKSWSEHPMSEIFSFRESLEMRLEEGNLSDEQRAAYNSWLQDATPGDLYFRELNANQPNPSYWYQDPYIVQGLRAKHSMALDSTAGCDEIPF